MQEKKILKVSFGKNGTGFTTTKLSLPSRDFAKMGITPENREVYYEFNEDENQMIISTKNQKKNKKTIDKS